MSTAQAGVKSHKAIRFLPVSAVIVELFQRHIWKLLGDQAGPGGEESGSPDVEKEERKREGETEKQTPVDTHGAEWKKERGSSLGKRGYHFVRNNKMSNYYVALYNWN